MGRIKVYGVRNKYHESLSTYSKAIREDTHGRKHSLPLTMWKINLHRTYFWAPCSKYQKF